ncbi:MAG TPA: hypothetical protein VHC22_30740 [Pirellulales bacterium]|nr:hypothetical protein [Pirellulales bacterium]
MDENRKKRGGAWAGLLLAILLVAYPLSIGPAVAILGATGIDPVLCRILVTIYEPLDRLPLPSPLDDALVRWIDAWDFYGLRDTELPPGC